MNIKPNQQELETLSFYNMRAEKFTISRKSGVRGYWDDELKRFKYYLPQGKIVEFGCGGGVEAAFYQSTMTI